MNRPLPALEEMLTIDLRALRISLGIPHPLAKFGAADFKDDLFADVVLHFIHVAIMEEQDLRRVETAKWFLLESDRTYFYLCEEAGIDAVKLRSHLREGGGFFGRLEA